MLYEELEMRYKSNYLEELAKKHRKEVGNARDTGIYLEDSAVEMAREMKRMWNRLNIFYDALLNVRNKALEGFEESQGLDTFKVIADMAQEALEKVVDNGKLREEVKNDKD